MLQVLQKSLESNNITMTYLSVVIPAYNEAYALRAGKLTRLASWLKEQAMETELIVVDDGSADETADLAEEVADRTVRIQHSGKAAAIVAGIGQASGEVVLFTDMDQATPISEVPKLLEAIRGSADVAIGSRGLVRPGAPLARNLLSWGQVAIRDLLVGLKITDTQCGFKAMKRAAALDILDHLRLYHPSRMRTIEGASVTSGFDVEFLFVAQRLGYRIAEIQVEWNYQETRRVRIIKDALRGISDLISIWLADQRGNYPRPVA
jgi:glycosyltransferase involved in cell wall biosynthesis